MVGTASNSEWRLKAACLDYPEDLWFGSDKEHPDDWQVRTIKAKEVCKTCPSKSACLNYAMKHEEAWGIWGGLDEWERLLLHCENGYPRDSEKFEHLVCTSGHLRRPDTIYHAPKRYSTCRVCRAINDELIGKARTADEVAEAVEKVAAKFPVETYLVSEEHASENEC